MITAKIPVETISCFADTHAPVSYTHLTATYVEELGLLTRAVFVVDKDNILRYVEYVREITDEPDYEAVLSCVKGI